MKRNVFTAVALLILGGSVFAQDINQTSNWLRNNTYRLDHVNCPTKELFGDNFEINEEGMRLYSDEANKSCSIKWEEIKDIQRTQDFIYVISEELYNDKSIVLKFYAKDQTNQLHFEKGFKYLANLKRSKSNNNL